MANTKHRSLVPVIDGFVSEDWAVRVALAGHQQQEWVQKYLDPETKYELLGLINRLGVPASYLRVDYCNRPNAAGDQAPLANITYDQLLTENNIIPWKFILFSTIGALPAYYRQCNQKTWPHLTKYLDDSDKYRDLDIGGIGPVGFDLSGLPPNNNEAMQTTEPSTSDTCHASSASGSRPTATPLDSLLPSTSTSGTHSVPGVDVEAIAASIAQKLFREGASASSAEELSKCALKIAMTSDSQKDSDHDPRKGQDREPRK